MIVAAVAVAAAGLIAHNVLSLPLAPLAVENVGPVAVYAALLAWCVAARDGIAARAALTFWAGLNLVGGALTVLPLPLLPFVPEQTVEHYAAHAIYAIAQVPLLGLLLTARRRPAGPPQGRFARSPRRPERQREPRPERDSGGV
ncbi:MAG: hypothetical protein H0W30_20275 [Gemmatimonadaceae bacterium]|nr:hypothetical protein [Gemmatimonadaceae bacterium]